MVPDPVFAFPHNREGGEPHSMVEWAYVREKAQWTPCVR